MFFARLKAFTTSTVAISVVDEDLLDESPWLGYAWSAASGLLVSVIATPLLGRLDLANIVMLFLLAVVMVAVKFGRRPALAAAVLNVLAFDFFFVPPRFSFSVHDAQYLLTFAVMMFVGLVVGELTADMRMQARASRYREHRAGILYEMARELGRAMTMEEVTAISQSTIEEAFATSTAVLYPDSIGCLVPEESLRPNLAAVDMVVAQWSYDHAEVAGSGTPTFPANAALYIPLMTAARKSGLLVIGPSKSHPAKSREQQQLLLTFAALMASAIERLRLVSEAQQAQIAMESERLRNSILAALSHDLRTPLTALVGMSDVLWLGLVREGSGYVRHARALTDQAMTTSSLVTNLLEMARLQAGSVSLRREWQSIEELAESALRSVETALSRHPLHLDLPDTLPLIYGDGVLLERVLANLFENAAKYTPEGTPITLTAWHHEADIFIEVSDSGPGLPGIDSELLFEKFSRGHKESSTSGVGLGLSICRAILKAHGGTINARNRPPPGHGAVLTWTLPHRESRSFVEPVVRPARCGVMRTNQVIRG